jgi:hypothetical protein
MKRAQENEAWRKSERLCSEALNLNIFSKPLSQTLMHYVPNPQNFPSEDSAVVTKRL